MKKVVAPLLLFWVVALQLNAQEFPKNETNNIRIDPFQWNTIDASEFCWAYDVVYDKNGSTISTGYLRGNVSDTSVQLASDHCGSFCTDKLYLAKHDKSGKREWINSAIGNIRPTVVRINKQGEICLAGSFNGKLPLFLGTHQTQATDSSASHLRQGLFITKYKSNGEIIACKLLSGMEMYAFELDDYDNFYIGGCDEFRTSKEWSLSRRKFKFQRINKNLTEGFSLFGDTLGDSHINSISIIKKQVLVMLTYSDTCKTSYFTLANNHEQQGALIYLTTDGVFKGIKSEVNGQNLNPGIAVLDKNLNVYMATGGYNHPQHIRKLNASGNIVWEELITKPSMNMVTKILLHKNEILFCGYGYGALFGVNSPQQYAYKAKTSTDFYIASYTLNGQVKWLKAGGDEATEYCQSIAVYKDELCAFGFVAFGGKTTFGQLTLNTKNTLWLAKFKLDSLAYMDVWKPNQIIAEPSPFSVNESDCSCKIKADGNENHFMPSVGSIIDDGVIERYLVWKMDSGFQLYKNAFVFNFYAQPSYSESYYSFKLYSVKPIKIIHPKKLFTLNLMPCLAENNWNHIPISLSISDGIKKYNRRFDSDNFDSSLYSVYDVLRTINNTNFETLLQRTLDEGDGYFNYNKWISDINKKYHLKVSKEFTDLNQLVQHVISQLENKQIDLDSFLISNMIKSGNHSPKIKPEEWQKLCDIFEYSFDRDLNSLFAFVFPSFRASASPKFISFELNPEILCAWNDIKQLPEYTNGKRKHTIILGQCSEFELNSTGITSLKINKWYHNKCNITGTKALLKIKNATYVSRNEAYNMLYSYDFNSLFRDSITKTNNQYVDDIYPNSAYSYSTDFSMFEGLLITEGNLWLPIGREGLKTDIKSLIINNNLLAGTIKLPLEIIDNGSWKIGTAQSSFTAKPIEWNSLLDDLGFDNISFEQDNTSLLISFVKRQIH
jgi:hypothetical protein